MQRLASAWSRTGINRAAVEPLVADYVARNRADPYAGAEHDRWFERELHAIADQQGMSDTHRAEMFHIAREMVEDATAIARAEMLEMIRRPRQPQIIVVKQPSGCAPVLWIVAIAAALLLLR